MVSGAEELNDSLINMRARVTNSYRPGILFKLAISQISLPEFRPFLRDLDKHVLIRKKNRPISIRPTFNLKLVPRKYIMSLAT